MASSRAAAPLALCILLLASPAVSATFLFDDGKSVAKSKGKGKAAVDVEWRPATATWYGDAEGDGSTGNNSPPLTIASIDYLGVYSYSCSSGLRLVPGQWWVAG